MKPRRTHSGFSLVELLTVVALVSVLATLGGVAVGPFFRNSELKKAVIEASAVLEGARQYALTYNTHTYVGLAETGSGNDRQVILASFASPYGVAAVDMRAGGTASADGESLVALSRPKSFRNVILGNPEAEGDITAVVSRGVQIQSEVAGEAQQFDRVIHFSPSGEARISPAKVVRLGFSIHEWKGSADTQDLPTYSLHVSGITGRVEVAPL